MFVCAGAALRGKPRFLVEHDGGPVPVDHHGLGAVQLLLGQFLARHGASALGRDPAGGDAQHLPRDQPVSRICALAIDADLPGTRPAADGGETDLRQVALEPAVQPHVVIILLDGELTNLVWH